MASIFDPQTLPESSMSGETSVIPTPASNIGERIADAGVAVSNLVGEVKLQKGLQQKEQVEQEFLSDLEQVASLKGERDQLKGVKKEDVAAYESAQTRVKEINSMLETKRLDPYEARTKVNNIAKKLINQVPFMARQIRQEFAGTGGGTFDSITQTMIDAHNKRWQDMSVNYNLDPTDPGQVRIYQNLKDLEIEAKSLQNQEIIHGVQGGAIASKYVRENISSVLHAAQNTLKGVTSVGDIPTDQREQILLGAYEYQKSPEYVAQSIVAQLDNVSWSQLPQRERDSLISMVKGAGEQLVATFDGKLPLELTERANSLFNSRVYERLIREDKPLAQAIAMTTFVPNFSTTPAGAAWQDEVATGMLYTAEGRALQDYSRMRHSSLSKVVDNPKVVQEQFSQNVRDLRRELEINGGKLDRELVAATMKDQISTMYDMYTNPSEYSPNLFDEMINNINSSEYRRVLEQSSPGEFTTYQKQAANLIDVYANKKLSRSIEKDLNNKVPITESTTGTSDRRAKRSLRKERLTLGSILDVSTKNGVLVFFPTTGIKSEDLFRYAKEESEKLNKTYSSRTSSIIKAAEVLGLTEAAGGPENYSHLLYQEPLSLIGETLKIQPEAVQEQQ